MTSHVIPFPTIVGIKVRLVRDIDRVKPCCNNIAVIHPGKAQHAGEFRCAPWMVLEITTRLYSRIARTLRRAVRADCCAPKGEDDNGFRTQTQSRIALQE